MISKGLDAFSTTTNATLLCKYHAIFLSTKGHTNVAIAGMLQLTQETIGVYINTYQNSWLASFLNTNQTIKGAILSPPFVMKWRRKEVDGGENI